MTPIRGEGCEMKIRKLFAVELKTVRPMYENPEGWVVATKPFGGGAPYWGHPFTDGSFQTEAEARLWADCLNDVRDDAVDEFKQNLREELA